jgi:hypothetical protein
MSLLAVPILLSGLYLVVVLNNDLGWLPIVLSFVIFIAGLVYEDLRLDETGTDRDNEEEAPDELYEWPGTSS